MNLNSGSGAGGMRVRASPFGGGGTGGGQALPPRPAMNLDWGNDDFFQESSVSAPAPAPTAGKVFAPQAMPQPVAQPVFAPQQAFAQPQPVQQQAFAQPQAVQQQPTQHPAAQPMMQPNAFNPAQVAMGAMAAMSGGQDMNQAMAGAVANQMYDQARAAGLTAWFPNVFLGLQSRFNVGHQYVLRKLMLLLCPFPFVPGSQGAPAPASFGGWSADQSPGGSNSNTAKNLSEDGLKVDVEDPDLYIPFMSYVTYVLVYGIQRGLMSDFKPEVLSATCSFGIVLLFLEVGVAKVGFYLAGSVVPVLDVVSNCGYKFAPLVLMVIARTMISSTYIYYVFFAYFAACAAFAVKRFLEHIEPPQFQQQYGVAPSALHGHVILAVAIAQVPLCWLLTPSAPAAVAAIISAPITDLGS